MNKQKRWKFLFISAPFGGIEVFSKNIKQVVDERDDIDASWIWIEPYPSEFISRIPPISYNWTLKGGYVAHSRVMELEKTEKNFDAVFFNHAIPAGLLSKFRKRVPMVLSLDVTPHILAPYSFWYLGHKSKTSGALASLKHKLLRSVYEDAVYLLPWSDLVRQSLVNYYRVNPEKVIVVPQGIDLKRWTMSPGEALRENKKKQFKKILFVGGEFCRKGGDLLLRLAHREEFRHCEFHFVTKSFKGSIGPNVIVHQNLHPNSELLLELYRTADVFALPTRADLSPNAVCEALAFQLPVVTTNVGGMNEIVKDNENGFLVPPDDEEMFAQKLHTLLQSPELCAKFGREGRIIVEEKYDIRKNAGRVIDFLIKAASKKSTNQKRT